MDELQQIQSVKSRIEAFIGQGHLTEAKTLLDQLDGKLPGDTDICSMRAVIHIMEGRLDDAGAVLQEGLKKDSVQFDLVFNLAYIHELQENCQLAAELYLEACTVAITTEQKQNVTEAIGRLKLMDANIIIKEKPKIVFFVKQGMDNFLGDIINGILNEYWVRKIIVSDFKQIDQGMRWADVCWFEWCDELVIYGSTLPLAGGKKIICRLHSYEAFSDYINKVRWNNVDKVVFVAEHIRNFALEKQPSLKREKTVVIPNGVDIDKYVYKERSPGFNLAYVGYINYKKGPMLLLHTFKSLYDRDDRYKLHLAGIFQDDRDQLYFNQMIKEFGLANNVSFDGWQENINQWLEDKNYILCTSVLEGNPVGIMEAMSRGIKPIIHNFVGAKGMYPEKYVWNTIDEALEMIRSEEYNSMEYRAFISDKFSLEKQVNKIKEVFSDLLSFLPVIDKVKNIIIGNQLAKELGMDDLTVLIPCYNRGKMLKEDIDKGLKLGRQPKMIVDDCSTVEKEWLDLIENKVNNQIRKNSNEGLAQARYTGLSNIKTKYTSFLDDDDILICLDKDQAMVDINLLQEENVLIIPRYAINWGGDQLYIKYDRASYHNWKSSDVLKDIAQTSEINAFLAGGTIGRTEELKKHAESKLFSVAEDFVMLSRILANNPDMKVVTTESLVHVRRIVKSSLSKNLSPYKLALGLLAQSIACYYCLSLGLSNMDDVLFWMKSRGGLIQQLYGFGESFEAELIAYLTGEISEEVFIHYLESIGLMLTNRLNELSPELQKMRALICEEL
jgi:glycosyltransferase involved in cell wall biosynthesis